MDVSVDPIGTGRQSYRSRLIKWLTLENEKKTAVSQNWRHKKEKPSYQSFSLMVISEDVGLEKQY